MRIIFKFLIKLTSLLDPVSRASSECSRSIYSSIPSFYEILVFLSDRNTPITQRYIDRFLNALHIPVRQRGLRQEPRLQGTGGYSSSLAPLSQETKRDSNATIAPARFNRIGN